MNYNLYSGFTRTFSGPTDTSMVFPNDGGTPGASLAALYALNNPIAYAGQIISAQQANGTWKSYLIKTDKSLATVITSADQLTSANILGLDAALADHGDRLTAVEATVVDLTDWTGDAIDLTVSGGITLTAGGTITLTGAGFTFNGASVITDDTFTWNALATKGLPNLELRDNRDIANGYPSLNGNALLLGSKIKIGNSLKVTADGTLEVQSQQFGDIYVVASLDNGVPVATNGTTGDLIEVGDTLIFKEPIGIYASGSTYMRYQITDHTIASDYVWKDAQAASDMDAMQQGTTNKYVSATMYGVMETLSISGGGALLYNGSALLTAATFSVSASAEFTGTGATGTPLTLALNAVAFSKMVNSGAVPIGWTIGGGQITSGTVPDARLTSTMQALPARVTKLEQADTTFTSTELVDGVLTVDATQFPMGVTAADGTFYPVAPETVTAKNGSGVRTFTLDLSNLTITGTWSVVF